MHSGQSLNGIPDWTRPDLIQEVAIGNIVVDELNPRKAASGAAMKELVEDVSAHGVEEPIKIRPL